MDSEDYIKFWGGERLVRWPATSLSSLDIPVRSKEFLSRCGMPTVKMFGIDFTPSTKGPSPHPSNPRLRVVGKHHRFGICLDEDGDGRVVLVRNLGAVEFLISSVEAFGLFLTFARQTGEEDDDALDAPGVWNQIEHESRMEQMVCRMRRVDFPAVSDTANWWPRRIVEDTMYPF